MKGIILAGGSGTRLYPTTMGTSKQLLSIYDKPMIYYPLSVLMESGIREILIITTQEDQQNFIRLLGDGHRLGISITFAVQPAPEGLAQAFIIGEKFIGTDSVMLILGDNIFIGNKSFENELSKITMDRVPGATIYCSQVGDPGRFGVVGLDSSNKIETIEEKPRVPRSNWAVTGLYCYDHNVVDIAKTIKPSERGELEITSINNFYLESGRLDGRFLGTDVFWCDSGTNDSLYLASSFVREEQAKRNVILSCPEEIAWRKGWLSNEQLYLAACNLKKDSYGKYLLRILKGVSSNTSPALISF
jgi:glucose-1-phosphate thymidylyltransferase